MSEIVEEFIHVKGKPNKMVVFLHGCEQDAKLINKLIAPLVNNVDNAVVAIPSSPYLCEAGSGKRQWYSMQAFDPSGSRKNLDNFDEVVKIYEKSNQYIKEAFYLINAYLDEILKKYKLKYKDLYICGFSQGASLSLYTALMLKEKIAGVVSFSGVLSPCSVLSEHYKNSTNVLLIHGKDDDIVKFKALEFSKQKLENMNCLVSTYAIDNTKHFITEDGLVMAASFINAKK